MDRRPDRRARIADRRRTARNVVGRGQLRHVLDGDFDCELQRLLPAGVDDGHRAVVDGTAVRRELAFDVALDVGLARAALHCGSRIAGCGLIADCGLGAAEEPRDFVERALRCGEADPLRRSLAVRLEPLERQREMRAALGRHQGVDFVDDDGVDRPQRLARVRRQQEIERFGRRDEDIRRIALESRALRLRRVAGADGNHRREVGVAPPLGDLGDPGERGAEVPLDVDGERLERRHVQHAAASACGRGREHQTIEAPQKCGQRLPAAGRGEDQRRFAAGDRGPAERLRPSRLLEGAAEPAARGRMKRRERIIRTCAHVVIL